MSDKIVVNNLNYRVNDKNILQSVSIKVKDGQFVGILGPNGSGKTTLLKHIYRVLPVNSNVIFVNGIDITETSIRQSSKFMTVMRQENTSVFDYTNLEMVLMGRSPHKKIYETANCKDLDIALSSLKYVGMFDYKDRLFNTLSGGEKQRVLMARSLAQETDIFILDEPTNHLDVYYQWNLMKLIKRLNKTVLAVFHDLSIALEYCDYIYVLNDGKNIIEGEAVEVLSKEILRDVFRVDGEIITTSNSNKRVVIYSSV
ncbi:ABC transporter ATP-binding protein [Johnsonella ignava]|uniref:ABC transporter ATP-binding protein n=1 Tax=Johnsonella ignava TaxID=43995 RepID=UPI0023F0FEC9|nr:ABC transporter ATP-binding protein [Johnsonella ignava]